MLNVRNFKLKTFGVNRANGNCEFAFGILIDEHTKFKQLT